MAKTTTMNTKVHAETVERMHELREEVHAPGKRILDTTGAIPDDVNIKGKHRVSRNSMEAAGEQLKLTIGPALAWLNEFDATTSMAENVRICFEELGSLYGMTAFLRQKYNLQMANSLVQDVDDVTPVHQMTQFESSNLIADQLRLMVSGENGGDPTEDYDFAEAYAWLAIQIDIFTQYALKGYRFVIGDQVGRGTITSADLMAHLGHELPNGKAEMRTRDITRKLGDQWHQFYLQVATGGRPAQRNFATDYWQDAMGDGHVVLVPKATLLAETQLSIVYLSETAHVTEPDYVDFIMSVSEGANEPVTREQAKQIWSAMKVAGVEIGAQTRLPNYAKLPKPGDLFEHHRYAWPIGHANAGLNVIPTDLPTDAKSSGAKPGKRKKIDWKI